MKPIYHLLVWSCLVITSTLSAQMPCDTALAGVTVNMSLSGSCRLDIDSTYASQLLSNYSSNLEYAVNVFDQYGDPAPMPLTDQDLDQTFLVMIFPTNCPDSSNIGWSYITLEDKKAPVLACVTDTLSCPEYATLPPNGIDECDIADIDILSTRYEPVCDPPIDGISSLAIRTFRVTDGSGNSSQCTDSTYIRRLTRDQIAFPQDTTISCEYLKDYTTRGAKLIAPSLRLANGTGTLTDQYVFGVPTGSGSSLYGGNFKACRARADYEDFDPYEAKPNCKYVYTRMWSVYEWYCDEEKAYTQPQTITFEDTTAPSFTLVEDTLYYSVDSDLCEIEIPTDSIRPYLGTISDNCTPERDLIIEYNYPYVIGAKNDSIIRIKGDDTITVQIIVRDLCHKEASKSLVIITTDEADPVALCEGTVTVPIFDENTNLYDIANFNRNSYDACGDVTLSALKMGDTIFRTGQLNFNCDDIQQSELAVILRATDAAGRTDECMSMVTFDIDTTRVDCDAVSSPRAMSVSGVVRYTDGMPAQRTSVSANGLYSMSTMTDELGQYRIDDYSSDVPVTIMPSKDDNHIAGITTMDLILIQRHILGINELSGAYEVIASDVNGDGNTNVSDVIEMRRLILGDIARFGDSESYAFVPADMTFDEPMDPWINAPLFGKKVDDSSADIEQDFVGVKIGDVNNSLNGAQSRSDASVQLRYEIVPMGQYFELNIYTDEELPIDGIQGVISFDWEMMRLMKIGNGALPISPEHYSLANISEGKIAISWSDIRPVESRQEKALLSMTFEQYYDGQPSFSMVDGAIAPEMYVDATPYIFELVSSAEKSGLNAFEIIKNVPNPWNNETSIEFAIPRDAEVTLRVYDAAMQSVHQEKKNCVAGKNKFTVGRSDLPYDGLYFYEIIYGDEVRVAKMTRL